MFDRPCRTSRPLLRRLRAFLRRVHGSPGAAVHALRIGAVLAVAGASLALADGVHAQAQPADVPVKSEASAESPLSAWWNAPEHWKTDRWYFQTSVATVHFNSDPDHDNTQNLIYGEYRFPNRWLAGQPFAGLSFFDNSFGQPSQFLFAGLLWRPSESVPEFYIKVAAGILHGYVDEFQDKVPFNHNGWSPGIVPGVGYCYKRLCGEMIMFGTAGMMWTVGTTLPWERPQKAVRGGLGRREAGVAPFAHRHLNGEIRRPPWGGPAAAANRGHATTSVVRPTACESYEGGAGAELP